uniref:Uncharacterized protein n=1 Tax=Tanacetum cinerariifolium TaxID=118510 RepID=A0A6L2NNZ7_TANCI|nr:hypothetical protein [Tanacetum cinerariifolium]
MTIESKVESVDVKNKGVCNTVKTKPVKRNRFCSLIIEDWIFDDENEVEFKPKVKDKAVIPSIEKIIFVKTARETKEKVTKISHSSGPTNLVADETVYKEWEDKIERVATTTSSLEAEQDNGNINRTQSMATLNEPLPQGTRLVYASCVKQFWTTTKVFTLIPITHPLILNHIRLKPQKKIKPKRKQRQATKVHSPSSEIPVEESVPTPSNDPLPSGEDSIQLNELIIFYTTYNNRQVESFEEKDSLGTQEDASKQESNIKDIDQDVDFSLVDEAQRRMHNAVMFRVDDLEGNEVIVDMRAKNVEKEVSTADLVSIAGEVDTTASVEDSATPTTLRTANVDDELTLKKTPIAIKVAKPKDKVKAKMIELEKPFKKKDQIKLNEEVARKLEVKMKAEIEEEERIAREKDEANREIIKLSIKERSKLLAELIESRRKYFAAKRAKEIRNKPPIKAQQKSLMCTYMKNIEGSKQNDFKGKSFDDIKKIFDKVYNSKRAGQELEQESAKKQKLDEQVQAKVANDDTTELKRCLEIVPEDDDVAIKATPLISKSPTIVDYKIYKEGNKSYFKIIRVDGNSQNYVTFGTIFKNFNIKDLEVLRSIVKERFEKTNPMDDMENLLFQTLKTMFEHHIKENIWKYQPKAVKLHNWKFYDSCGVYLL